MEARISGNLKHRRFLRFFGMFFLWTLNCFTLNLTAAFFRTHLNPYSLFFLLTRILLDQALKQPFSPLSKATELC